MLLGQPIEGTSLSVTITLKPQDEKLPQLLVAEQVTLLVPTPKKLPDGGEHAVVIVPVQHPDAVIGAGYVTTAPHWPRSLV